MGPIESIEASETWAFLLVIFVIAAIFLIGHIAMVLSIPKKERKFVRNIIRKTNNGDIVWKKTPGEQNSKGWRTVLYTSQLNHCTLQLIRKSRTGVDPFTLKVISDDHVACIDAYHNYLVKKLLNTVISLRISRESQQERRERKETVQKLECHTAS